MSTQTGWKPIPLSLKILFVLFILWSIGAVMNVSNLYTAGLPLFGTYVYGIAAALVVLVLDIIGPLTFIVALWKRKQWAPKWAYAYNGLFILNNSVAFFTVRDELGVLPIVIPTVVSALFCLTIFFKRGYFK